MGMRFIKNSNQFLCLEPQQGPSYTLADRPGSMVRSGRAWAGVIAAAATARAPVVLPEK